MPRRRSCSARAPTSRRRATQLLEVLNSKDRIPAVSRRGDWLYNLWQDEHAQARPVAPHHAGRVPQGRSRPGRRCSTSTRWPRPRSENWVWGGAELPRARLPALPGLAVARRRRRQGGARVRHRRQGLRRRRLRAARGQVRRRLGRRRHALRRHRLRPRLDDRLGLPAHRQALEARHAAGRGDDGVRGPTRGRVRSASASTARRASSARCSCARLDFYHQERFAAAGRASSCALDVPDDARCRFMHSAGVAGDTLLLELRSDLTRRRAHAPQRLAAGRRRRRLPEGRARASQVLFEPTATRSLAGYRADAQPRAASTCSTTWPAGWRSGSATPTAASARRAVDAPLPGTLGVSALHDPLLRDDPLAEHYLLSYTDFLTPDSLLLGAHRQRRARAAEGAAGLLRRHRHARRAALRDQPRRHARALLRGLAAGREGRRHATRRCCTATAASRSRCEPWYSRGFGRAWYARGGVLVVANIRGGGEFGPAWHQAAMKANKQRSYDDFIAVAEDLIARKITSPRAPRHRGRQQRRAAGRRGDDAAARAVQRRGLPGAAARHEALPQAARRRVAGWPSTATPTCPTSGPASRSYSPYQNVQAATCKYPQVLFTTSTRDDRVHPGHARKMVARHAAQGHAVLYYENIEGGHGGAADNEQRAHAAGAGVHLPVAAARRAPIDAPCRPTTPKPCSTSGSARRARPSTARPPRVVPQGRRPSTRRSASASAR